MSNDRSLWSIGVTITYYATLMTIDIMLCELKLLIGLCAFFKKKGNLH